MDIEAKELGYAALNDAIRSADGDCRILGCLGQRFIAAGMSDRRIEIHGIPGNALGAYLDGAQITVYGNAQDAVGDTMNDGSIVIHGNIGDAAGYAMRGGTIFVRGNAGYRAQGRQAHRGQLPLHRYARRQADFARGRVPHPLPGADHLAGGTCRGHGGDPSSAHSVL